MRKKHKVIKVKSRGGVMKRRRFKGAKRSGLMSRPNLIPPLIVSAVAGIGASMLAQKFLGQKIPMQDNIVGYLAGGLPGAVAPLLLGSGIGGSKLIYLN